MRSRLPRLTAVFAAAALILGTVAVATPANAVDPGNGIIALTLVDDLGHPVTGAVELVPSDGSGPVSLGVPDGGGTPVAASSFAEEVPAGTYGVLVMGGWAGLTCVGLATCSITTLLGGAGLAVGAGALTIGDGATAPLTVTIATPKLNGTPGVGRALTVSVPSSLTELGAALSGMGGLGLGLSSDPVVTWNRNGGPIGVTGPSYTPTGGDAGSTISATVTYPVLLSLLFSTMGAGATPPPFTTAAVKINRLTPRIKLSLPGKVLQGQRPKAYVNVTSGTALVGGVVTFAVDKLRAQQGVLRSGLATFTLPKLKPGKHKVTVSFAAAGAYNAAKATKTVVVKAKKHKK
ncbi:Ig-like domain repeat protein [Nocardioides conyzicola]|uniref:Ig-like domain repeat protein n=1 Tax=Nocardioides conyzicola TaxID=1651781 RepID=A0ABP8XFI1_9ACTN